MVLTWRYFVLAVACGVPVLVWPSLGLVAWLLLGLVVLGALDLVLAPPVRSVTAERTPGPRVRLGNDTWADLRLVNTAKRRVRLHVRDAWTPTAGARDTRFRLVLGPGEEHTRRIVLRPERRGLLPADRLTVRSATALGLVVRQRSFAVPAAITVTPVFRARKHLPSKLARLRELDGRTSVMVRGEGTEFDSLKDYVRGDDVRSIDWRATARSQKLVVRTWRPERDRRVVVVLDSSRLSAVRNSEGTVFDTVLETGMLLAALAAMAGDRVDVIAADARVRTHVGPVTGRDPLGRLSGELADVHPELYDADWTDIASTVMATSRQHAFVVLVTPLDHATISEDLLPVLPLLTSRHTVAIASPGDETLVEDVARVFTPTQVHRAAAAQKELLLQTSLARALSDTGVHTVTGAPGDLPPRLADLYIRLKTTGRL